MVSLPDTRVLKGLANGRPKKGTFVDDSTKRDATCHTPSCRRHQQILQHLDALRGTRRL
jgi:hypothetical protein